MAESIPLPTSEDPDKRSILGAPWRDLRALASSTLFHVLLLAVAWLVALRVSTPAPSPSGFALPTSIEPVDNRVLPQGDGGGAPGELGGAGAIPSGPARLVPSPLSPSDSQLLNELTKPDLARDSRPDAPSDLPGPPTSGIGALPGLARGGGGGQGRGSGAGSGPGIGPGTQFFGAAERASSFVYVIDRSGSMEQSSALEIAKAELLGSLDRLPPDTRFAVVFYNLDPERVVAEDGGLLSATIANKERIRTLSRTLKPYGGTDHVAALRAGLRLKPEVIYFLTDGQRMSPDDVARLIAEAGGRTRIQAIEFGQGPALGASANLERLAQGTGGGYRYLDVAKLRMDRNARANP